jgi:hypothetical protein
LKSLCRGTTPGPTTQSHANRDFPVHCEMPRTGGHSCSHFVSASHRFVFSGCFGGFVSGRQYCVSRRRRPVLAETQFECWVSARYCSRHDPVWGEANGNRKAEIHICARQRGSVAVRRRDWSSATGQTRTFCFPPSTIKTANWAASAGSLYVSLITLPFDPHRIFMCRILFWAELIRAGYCAHAVPRTTP